MKFAGRIMALVAAAALIAACHMEAGEDDGAEVSLAAERLLSRAALEDSGAAYSVTMELDADGKKQRVSKSGTLSQLKGETFEFKRVKVGAVIKITCQISYIDGTVLWSGTSEEMIAAREIPEISLKMDEQEVDAKGAFGSSNVADAMSGTTCIIPYGYTSIADDTFKYNETVARVVIPDTVTSMGSNAFNGCKKLTSVNIPEKVTALGNNLFQDCSSLASVSIPGGVTSIGESAFYGCASLTSASLPSGLRTISSNAFRNCNKLAGIKIPGGVTSIGESAFYGCESLSSMDIPGNVGTIPGQLFASCKNLASVTIRNGDYTSNDFGSDIFSNCGNLKSIFVPSGAVEKYKEYYNLSDVKDKIKPIQ